MYNHEQILRDADYALKEIDDAYRVIDDKCKATYGKAFDRGTTKNDAKILVKRLKRRKHLAYTRDQTIIAVLEVLVANDDLAALERTFEGIRKQLVERKRELTGNRDAKDSIDRAYSRIVGILNYLKGIK